MMLEDPEISIHYALTYREYVAGQKLGVRQSLPLLIFHILIRFCTPIAVFILLLMCFVNLTGGHGNTIPPILPLIFLLSTLPCIIWLSWRYGYKRLQRSRCIDPKMTFQANQTSFARQIHDMGDLTWLWSATHGIAVNKKVLLVAARKGAFIIIPRRVISDDQITRLKAFLQESKRDA